MGQTDKRTDHGHDEMNDAWPWLTPEQEEAAQIHSMLIGEALAKRLIARTSTPTPRTPGLTG